MSNDENQTPQWQWTNKGPALLLGVILTLAGVLVINGRWKYSLPIGAVLIAGGLTAVVYSTTVHEWCAPAGRMKFGAEFGSAFWHGPNAWDCWHLVNPMGPKR